MAAGRGCVDRSAINQRVIWVEMDVWREQIEAHGHKMEGEAVAVLFDTTTIAVVDRHDDGVFSMRDSGLKHYCVVIGSADRNGISERCLPNCCSHSNIWCNTRLCSIFIIPPTLHECSHVRDRVGLFFLCDCFTYQSSFVKDAPDICIIGFSCQAKCEASEPHSQILP